MHRGLAPLAGLAHILVVLTSCGGGGVEPPSAPAALPPIPTIEAAVLSVTWPASPQGHVSFQVEVAADDGQPVHLRVERSFDGGITWHPATILQPELLSDLAAPTTGETHAVEWDSLPDVGFRGFVGARLRFTPWRAEGVGTAHVTTVPVIDNFRVAVDRVDHYFIHSGFIDGPTLRMAETYQLAIVHPFVGQLNAAVVADIKDGVDPADPGDDVLVLAHISIGADLRTVTLTDAQMLQDPRFVGDGTGPRIDPRGPDADGTSLEGLDPLGLPSNGGTGYASWYLDDNSVDQSVVDVGDGLPDRNADNGGCFVNAGDPAWFDVLDQMTFDGVDGIPGLAELLTSSTGRGYACDGVLLDTVDTCAPNSFTDSTSLNQSEYEWTAAGMGAFMERLRTRYPRRLVLQKRGMFLFDPRHPHHAVTTRPYVDFVLLENYRLNNNTSEEFDAFFFPDNKHNLTPKLMAEASRPDGFRVLSLGYAEGPPGAIARETLIGQSTEGFASLVEDIVQTQELAGFRHYLTDGSLNVANDFVRRHADLSDSEAPVWSSTYNDNPTPFPAPPVAPTPRVGIQAAESSPCCITVRWDVALDLHPVGYALYYQTTPFDFDADPDLSNATRIEMPPEAGPDYGFPHGPVSYPNEYVLTGLTPDTVYHLCIRAFDTHGNEEKNRVVLQGKQLRQVSIVVDGSFADWDPVLVAHQDAADVADSAGPDWLSIWITNDDTNLYIRYTSENAFNLDGSPDYTFSRTIILVDVDDDPATGYPAVEGMGSELLVSGNGLYAQTTDQFNDGLIQTLSISPDAQRTDVELAIPLTEITDRAPDASRLRLVFFNDDVLDWAPDVGVLFYRLIPSRP